MGRPSVLARLNEMIDLTPHARVILIGEADYQELLTSIAALHAQGGLDEAGALEPLDDYRGCAIAICEDGAELVVKPRACAYWEEPEAYRRPFVAVGEENQSRRASEEWPADL